MTVQFTESIDKEMEKTKAMMQELSERIEAHKLQYLSLGAMINEYQKEFGKVESRVESESTTGHTKKRSKACPECGLLCKSRHGMTRHRHVAHGVIPTEKPHCKKEEVQEPSTPAPSPICEKSEPGENGQQIEQGSSEDSQEKSGQWESPKYRIEDITDSSGGLNTVKPPSDVESKGALPDGAVRFISTGPNDVESKEAPAVSFVCSKCGRNDFTNKAGHTRHEKNCTGPKPTHSKTRECEHCHKQVNRIGFWKHLIYCKERPKEAPKPPVVQNEDGVLTIGDNRPEPAAQEKPRKVLEYKKKGDNGNHLNRKCLACGISISENAAHPYCDKCWKLTKHKSVPGSAGHFTRGQ